MGVSGCGKTSAGMELATRLGLAFTEGDALHPTSNVVKMSAGIPLTDNDRWPWLDLIGDTLRKAHVEGSGLVVTCSSLKKHYRDRMRAAAGGRLFFVFLQGSRPVLCQRLAERRGHFFPPALLDSQLAALEDPSSEPDVIVVDINAPLRAIADAACAGLAEHGVGNIGVSRNRRKLTMDEIPPANVAVIGAGIMGSAIASRLIERGQAVTVFDLDQAKVAALTHKGAKAATSAAGATRANDFVILSLNHAEIVRAVVFGENGVAEGATAAKLLIDMSSIDPVDTAQMAKRLAEETGMKWVDCPLSGGAPGALAGRLTVMAGGETADFERAHWVMRHLCANYTLMGPNGAGQTTKLINQLFCAVQFQAVAEAVKLAEAGGVDPKAIPAALKGGRANSSIMQEFMEKFAARDFSPTGRIDNMLKDLNSLQAFALKTKTPLPMTGQVVEIHRLLCVAGLGPKDSAEMMRLLDGCKPCGMPAVGA